MPLRNCDKNIKEGNLYTQLIFIRFLPYISNSLISVHGAETKTIPATGERVDVTECTPVFAGMKYCTALQYSDAMQTDESPYFPFTGDSK